MLADQRDKCAATMVFCAVTSFCFYNAYQPLRFTRFADRHDQTPADLQLHNQRLRYYWTTCRDYDRVVRRMCSPTERTVETLDRGVIDSELTNPAVRLAREIADAFDGVNLCGNHRQHRCLIARPGADLQHATVAVELEQLGHARNDERL